MGSELIQGLRRVPPEERLNVCALVIYIPGPLGKFLDDLRRELVPSYNPHAHVSVLPPRSLAVDWRVASEQTRALLDRWQPFEIELTGVEIFPVTDVIYIGVGAGGAELRRMHGSLNADALEFQDPFPYHPHITLAQDLPGDQVEATNRTAQRLWQEFRGERRFRAEHAVFVQNTLNDCWIDLAEYTLGGSSTKS